MPFPRPHPTVKCFPTLVSGACTFLSFSVPLQHDATAGNNVKHTKMKKEKSQKSLGAIVGNMQVTALTSLESDCF